MAGGILGPSDYAPWLTTPESWTNMQSSFNLGAQVAQNRIQNALKQKELELDQQRSMIQTQEYFSKKEIQNQLMAGTSEAAQVRSRYSKDLTNPQYLEDLYGVAAKNPHAWGVVDTLVKEHEKATEFQQKQEELKQMRLSREAYQFGLLGERTAKRLSDSEFQQQKIDIWQQKADTGQADAENRAEWRDFQKDMSLLSLDERAKRLEISQQNAETRNARLEFDMQKLAPERRDEYKLDRDRLDAQAERGAFAEKKSGDHWYTAKEKFGEKYQEARKKLRESYGISGGPTSAPVQGPPSTAVSGAPPKPAGMSDADLLRAAADRVEKDPASADEVNRRLKAWGLAPQ